jgi:signal transduction histidine kinase
MMRSGVGPVRPLDDNEVDDRPPAGTGEGDRRVGGGGSLFVPLITLYAIGLLFWLVLGLLPTLAQVFAPLRHWAQSVALSSSPFAGPAARILDANQSMPGMEMNATRPGSVALQYGFSVLNLALGAVLALRFTHRLVPRLLAFALLGTAATFNKPSHAVFHILGEPWPVKSVHFTFHIVSGVAYLWAVLLFPDGRLPRQIRLEGRSLALVAAVLTLAVSVVSWRSSFVDHPQFFVVFFGVAIPVFGLGALALRIRDPEVDVVERRSSRLLAAALLPAFAVGAAWLVGRVLWAMGGSAGSGAEHFDTVLAGVFPAVFAVVPVVLFAGILKYRLWNVDWLLSRALVYGFLGAAVAAAYVAAVSLSNLFAGRNLWSSVVVLTLVAVAIDPARRLVRGWSNRVVYGQVLSPTDAVRAMLGGLESVEPGADLHELARVSVQATRARRSELWLGSGADAVRVSAWPDDAGAGAAVGQHLAAPDGALGQTDPHEESFDVGYKGSLLGTLRLAIPAGEDFDPSERALIDSLAAHAGVVVHNAGLNRELAQHVAVLAEQVEELRAARRRLVTAQDLERRRLERDLHDGAQQSLVAILIGLRSMRRSGAAPSGSATPGREVEESEAEEILTLLGQAEAMLGELVSDEGPRVLTERGLVGALAAAGQLAARTGPEVNIGGSVVRELPADVAAAIYFCCLEALQNATKHADASSVRVNVSDLEGGIRFEVADDGRGFDPSEAGPGSGMGNLANRLAVLGGEVLVESAPGKGTRVEGWVPVGAGT